MPEEMPIDDKSMNKPGPLDWKSIQIRRSQVVVYNSGGEYRSNVYQMDRIFAYIKEHNLDRDDLINMLCTEYVGDDLHYTDGTYTDFELIMILADCGFMWIDSDTILNESQP